METHPRPKHSPPQKPPVGGEGLQEAGSMWEWAGAHRTRSQPFRTVLEAVGASTRPSRAPPPPVSRPQVPSSEPPRSRPRFTPVSARCPPPRPAPSRACAQPVSRPQCACCPGPAQAGPQGQQPRGARLTDRKAWTMSALMELSGLSLMTAKTCSSFSRLMKFPNQDLLASLGAGRRAGQVRVRWPSPEPPPSGLRASLLSQPDPALAPTPRPDPPS